MEITPLPTTLEEASAYASKDGRIVPWAEYGKHIPLQCKKHPHLRWSTKNIGWIGARSIFYNLMGESREPECSCSGNELEPTVPEDWQGKIVPLRIVHCRCCKEPICEETSTFSNGSCHECFDARCFFHGNGKCLAGKREE